MVTRRLMYIFMLAGSVLFYTLYSHWFSWYLLVLIVLMIPLDLLVSLPGMLTRRIILTAPMILRQDSEAVLTAVMLRSGPFPIKCIRARLRSACDGLVRRRRIVCGAERGAKTEIKIDTSKSGVTVFKMKRYWTVSLLNLFSMPATVKTKVAVLILPPPVRPANTLSLPRGDTLRPKPGGGYSEDHDLREYRQGDQLRSIHWKVSAKHDTLIVREPLVPSLHSRLVRITNWNDPRERDLILGRLLWVCDYLLKMDLQFYVRFGDDGPIAEVSKTSDLENYLYNVLSGASHMLNPPGTLPARFTWEFRVDAAESDE